MTEEQQKELQSVFAISEDEAHTLREMAEQTVFCRDPRRRIVWEEAFANTAAGLLTAKITDITPHIDVLRPKLAVFDAYSEAGDAGILAARNWAADALHRVGISVHKGYRCCVTDTVWNKTMHAFATRCAVFHQDITNHDEGDKLRAAVASFEA